MPERCRTCKMSRLDYKLLEEVSWEMFREVADREDNCVVE
jgi:hypothetical protein